MSDLRPCPDCQRHVRISETACPFCSAELEPMEPAAPSPRRTGASVTRAALFAGATLLGGAACADKPEAQEPEKVQTQTDAAPIDDGVDKDGNRDQEAIDAEEAERKRAAEEEERRRQKELQREREIRDRDIAKPYGAPPSREKTV